MVTSRINGRPSSEKVWMVQAHPILPRLHWKDGEASPPQRSLSQFRAWGQTAAEVRTRSVLDGSLWPKPTPFSPQNRSLERGPAQGDTRNTAPLCQPHASWGKECLDCERIPHRDGDGRGGGWLLGPLFLFPTPVSIASSFSHFKGPDTKNVPIWSGGLHRIEIFILQNPVQIR